MGLAFDQVLPGGNQVGFHGAGLCKAKSGCYNPKALSQSTFAF